MLIIPGETEPDSAWITVKSTEYPMVCSALSDFGEVHCDAPAETRDQPLEDVTSIGFVMGEERIDVSLESAYFEDGGECNRPGWYFFRHTESNEEE